MEEVNFSIKMVDAMTVSGEITKWKDLAFFITKTTIRPMKECG